MTDTDQPTYHGITLEKVLERQAKEKKDWYLQACVKQRCSFALLVYLVDGIAAKETRAFVKRILFTAYGQVEYPLQQDGRIRSRSHGSGCRAWRHPKTARLKTQDGLVALIGRRRCNRGCAEGPVLVAPQTIQ